ncbi:MAG: V-type ATP synthase subunit I [Clostridia bacterium]|nr:V-type ATP synthase subunit I [Clostridia bacterium]
MAVDKVQKVTIVGMSSEFEAVSAALQRMRALHIDEIIPGEGLDKGQGGQTLSAANAATDRVSAALSFLNTYYSKKSGLLSQKPVMTPQELLSADCPENWMVVEELEALRTEMAALTLDRTKKTALCEALRPYEALRVPLADIKDTQNTRMYLGTVPQQALQTMIDDCANTDAVIEQVGGDEQAVCIYMVVSACYEKEAEAAMRTAGFAQADPGVPGVPAQEIARAEQALKENEAAQAALIERVCTYGEKLSALEKLSDACAVKYQQAALKEQSGQTEKTFMITGWVRARQAEKLREALMLRPETLFIQIEDAAAEDVPPTAFKNGRLLSNFETVTEMYSLPNAYEADPTAIMAPFFFCFFGMMMSDAGYGIVMTLVLSLFLRLMRPQGTLKKIAVVVVMGGLSSLIWGILFGGWFGVAFFPALWFEPLEDPMKMLIVSLAIGLVHITLGLVENGRRLLTKKRYVDAFCDTVFILCILWGAIGMLLGVPFCGYIALIGVIGLFLTAGRDRKGIISKFTGGFSAVYGLTSYLSDILSYSRLFGMGLTTGVIALVFNTLAEMVMTGPIGYVFGVVLLLVGHTFNVLINALGAYVHSCRLQYIEFYGKFYEGGGRAFVPYAYQTKYVQLSDTDQTV